MQILMNVTIYSAVRAYEFSRTLRSGPKIRNEVVNGHCGR